MHAVFLSMRTATSTSLKGEPAAIAATGGRRVMIIVPPFHSIERPAIGAHIVQAECASRGVQARVVYLNLAFADLLGFEAYSWLCQSPTHLQLGESIFSLNAQREAAFRHVERHTGISVAKLAAAREDYEAYLRAECETWEVDVVAATMLFQQANASLTTLQVLKQLRPDVVTALGGGQCSPGLAEGIVTLAERHYPGCVDYVFAGESEVEFVDVVCKGAIASVRPTLKVAMAQRPMDDLPTVEYADYFAAAAHHSSKITTSLMWLPLEASRGCWWGAKSHCTFCALNKDGMNYRRKSDGRILDELDRILDQPFTRRVWFVDNIMPADRFRSILPQLERRDAAIYLEVKVPLRFKDVKALRDGGVVAVQPGIETLNDGLLRRMRKGNKTYQNIAFLRHSRILNLRVEWNLLYDIPGETADEYEQIVDWLPMLEHLRPPGSVSPIEIERFSPYFEQASEFGIENLRPVEAYMHCFPSEPQIGAMYTCFEADYPVVSRTHPELFARMSELVALWRESWERERRELEVSSLGKSAFLLKDTRRCRRAKWTRLDREQAATVLIDERSGKYTDWAAASGYVIRDGARTIPLATCAENLFLPLLEEAPKP
jgi:ribosomal peptide maturation radical SAM protein 1